MGQAESKRDPRASAAESIPLSCCKKHLANERLSGSIKLIERTIRTTKMDRQTLQRSDECAQTIAADAGESINILEAAAVIS